MWLLENKLGHKHPYQSDLEALASIPLQTYLCHVSYHRLFKWRLVRTSWFITTMKGNTISLGLPCLWRFTQCPARHPQSLEQKPHCIEKPHCCLVRSLAWETCWALMSTELQSPSELVPKFLKAWNATVVSLLIYTLGSMASPVLRIWAASPDIHASTSFSKGHWPALVSPLSWSTLAWQGIGGLMVWLWTLGTRAGASDTIVVDTFAPSCCVVSTTKPGNVATDAEIVKCWKYADLLDNHSLQPVAIKTVCMASPLPLFWALNISGSRARVKLLIFGKITNFYVFWLFLLNQKQQKANQRFEIPTF